MRILAGLEVWLWEIIFVPWGLDVDQRDMSMSLISIGSKTPTFPVHFYFKTPISTDEVVHVSFEDCVVWARPNFETFFNNQIRQLLHSFPPDQVTSSGTKFWSGSKRCPKALSFDLESVCEDAEMKNHLDFVVAANRL